MFSVVSGAVGGAVISAWYTVEYALLHALKALLWRGAGSTALTRAFTALATGPFKNAILRQGPAAGARVISIHTCVCVGGDTSLFNLSL